MDPDVLFIFRLSDMPHAPRQNTASDSPKNNLSSVVTSDCLLKPDHEKCNVIKCEAVHVSLCGLWGKTIIRQMQIFDFSGFVRLGTTNSGQRCDVFVIHLSRFRVAGANVTIVKHTKMINN